MPYLGIFWARILENYCHISNQHPQIFLTAKFCEESKMLKFRTKNAIFGYFWPKMPYFDIFGLEFKKKTIVIFEISAFELVRLQTFMKKQKCLNFGPKMPYLGFLEQKCLFGYFWARVFKKLLSYLKSAHSNLSICEISRKNNNA